MNTPEVNVNATEAPVVDVANKYDMVKREYSNKLLTMFDETKKKFATLGKVNIPSPENPQVSIPFDVEAESMEIIDKVFVPLIDIYTDENLNFDKAYATAQTDGDIQVLIASYAQFLGMMVDSKVKIYQQSTQLLGTRQSALQVQFTQIKNNILSDLASSCIMVINTIAENLAHHCRKNGIKTEDQFYPKEKDLYLFLDVETVGMKGSVFAYGAVIADVFGNVIKEECAWIDPAFSHASTKDLAWVDENIVPKLVADEKAVKLIFTPPAQILGLNALEQHFMDNVMNKYPHLQIVADCPYPFEARFLEALDMYPMPVIDVASMLLLIGKDPVASYERLEDEKQIHHPLHDARQTKRMFFEIINGRGKQLQYRYDEEEVSGEESSAMPDDYCEVTMQPDEEAERFTPSAEK